MKSIKMSQKTQRWEWAIALDLNDLSDQHLHQAYKLNWDNLCKFDSCRKNCKRILCLACFDRTWIDSENPQNYYNFDDSNCELQKRADLKSFVGLKNLGATCYVNCLLQLWFHNPALRKAIYEWDNNSDSNHSGNEAPRQNQINSNHTNNKYKIGGDDNNSGNQTASRRAIQEAGIRDDEPYDLDHLSSSSSAKRFKTSQDGSSTPRIVEEDKIPSMRSHEETPSSINSLTTAISPQRLNNRKKSNPVEQLQLVFARLQFTNKKSIDPFNFIESLALNAAEQQDAQEFGNLFIEFLERSCANQKNSFVSNIIKNQFKGQYSYNTICDHCKHNSVVDSSFHELDLSIQNLDTLHDCLRNYFKPKPLDGKYNCSHCPKAQSAHREILLKSLPPTLNLQLLRFVYDKQRNARQKLNSYIIFPEILDMTPYLHTAKTNGSVNNINRVFRPNPFDLSGTNHLGAYTPNGTARDRSNIYVLTAVLIHRGSSPHSGHYIAHIKDRVTKDWYKFNDDSVERIGPQLQVSSEGENITIVEERSDHVRFNDPSTGKVIKMESKSLKSKTAYMLVYQAHDNEALTYPSDSSEKWELPDHLQTAVLEENSRSHELFESIEIAREVDEQVMNARRTQIRTIYDKLVCRDPTEKYEFIDRIWLQNWLTNSSTSAKFPPIDNSNLLCIHDKLDFRKIDQVKCVRTEGADLLYKEFGGGPRLQDAMCKQCVEFEVKLIQLKERMKEDQKFMTSRAKFTLKADYDFADAYIVGKNSYRDWQALVMLQFERSHPELMGRSQSNHNASSDEDDNKDGSEANNTPQQPASIKNEDESGLDSDEEAMEKFVFNSDILCEHSQLVNDPLAWRIVPKEVWAIFKRYFGDDPERPLIERNANTLMCADCKRQEVEQQEIGDIQKQIASQQKTRLLDLFHNRKRASWCSMLPGEIYYALDRKFLTKWQKFIRNPCNQEKPTQVQHLDKLVCSCHKMSLYNHNNSNPLIPECPFVLISPNELVELKQLYEVDYDIKFYVDPQRVDETMKAHITNQRQNKKSHGHIQSSDNQMGERVAFKSSGSNEIKQSDTYAATSVDNSDANQIYQTEVITINDISADEVDPSDIDWTDSIVSDPPYCSECHEVLKQFELKKLLNYESATIYINKCENRTARRNRSREQAYNVKPTQTLLELKKEIFNRCQVLPVDQRLFLDDVLLDDNAKTMSELRIVPNCSLRLEIDRPIGDNIDHIEDEPSSRKQSGVQPETGFKGSLLLSNPLL